MIVEIAFYDAVLKHPSERKGEAAWGPCRTVGDDCVCGEHHYCAKGEGDKPVGKPRRRHASAEPERYGARAEHQQNGKRCTVRSSRNGNEDGQTDTFACTQLL